jgi:hypothetical protein
MFQQIRRFHRNLYEAIPMQFARMSNVACLSRETWKRFRQELYTLHGLKKTLFLCGASSLNRARNSRCNHRPGHLKTEHTGSLLLRLHLGDLSRGPAISMRRELLVAHGIRGEFPLLIVYVGPCRARNNFFINFWNYAILLCMPCILNTRGLRIIEAEIQLKAFYFLIKLMRPFTSSVTAEYEALVQIHIGKYMIHFCIPLSATRGSNRLYKWSSGN